MGDEADGNVDDRQRVTVDIRNGLSHRRPSGRVQQPTTASRQVTQLADTVTYLPMQSWCGTDDQ